MLMVTARMRTYPVKIRNGDAGYTLLELLVVVAIISLVVSAAPAIYSRLIPSYQVRQYSNQLAVFARGIREEARSSGNIQSLLFDRETKQIAEVAGMPVSPVSVEVVYDADPVWGGADVDRLTFYANGASNGGTITVSRDNLVVRITIDWVSGAIGVE